MQMNRLFEMIYILLEKETVPAKALAERFEVSTRTIYRDIDTLSSAGIPIYMKKGKGGGISLLPDFVLNKTVLTDAEKTNIMAALKAVSLVDLSDTDTALSKLSSLLGEGESDWLEVEFTSWGNINNEKKTFNTLKKTILSKCTIRFSYASGRGESMLRTVYPLKLCFKGQDWYLYGYCTLRKDHRFFKLKRIQDLQLLDETFEMQAPSYIFKDDKVFEEEYLLLKLKLAPHMAYRVYDEFQDFQTLSDGSFIAEIMYPKGEWVYSYIASFGDACEVLSPLDVREETIQRLKKTLEKYL
ncbi:MAG: helix-turn-helix transcriptional regulator [Cellulosilyticaceae bacterium]